MSGAGGAGGGERADPSDGALRMGAVLSESRSTDTARAAGPQDGDQNPALGLRASPHLALGPLRYGCVSGATKIRAQSKRASDVSY